jgi:dipeptidase E
MLLTSAGLVNAALEAALRDLLARDFATANVVVVTTASTATTGRMDWHVTELNRLYQLGWAQFNVLELNGLPRPMVLDRLETADAIYVGGGNAYHLAHSIVGNDLAEPLLDMLARKVYVGASAGSMIFTRDFTAHMVALFGGDDELYRRAGRVEVSPFNLFDWYLYPHGRPPRRVGFPVLSISDGEAVQVVGERVTRIGGPLDTCGG